MHVFSVYVLATLIGGAARTSSVEAPLEPPPKTNINSASPSQQHQTKKIAIIGAGLAGATTAYYLYDLVRELQDVDITIFESESQIGGRIKSIKYRGLTIEVGAPSASTQDRFFLKAMGDVGLSPQLPDWGWLLQRMETTGVWNGVRLINMEPHEPQCTTWWELLIAVWVDGRRAWAVRKVSLPEWWQLARSMWRYGLSPWTIHRSSSEHLQSLRAFGPATPPWERHPFSGIGPELRNSGLGDEALGPADAYTHQLNLSARFLEEVVGPCNRARFSKNTKDIRGIAADVAYREYSTRKVSVQDGNYRLVERLIALSKASVRLESKVREVHAGRTKLHSVLVESSSSNGKHGVSSHWEEFDAVVIATPFSLSGIHVDGNDALARPVDAAAPDLATHITHFASSRDMSPRFFNLSSETNLPTHILTTANSSHTPDIWSISLINQVTYIDTTFCFPWDMQDCDTVVHENVYRVVSSASLDDDTLIRMVDGPAGFVVPFVHRQVWPYIASSSAGVEQRSDDYEISTHMYYTGGADDIFPSLELSCRMGYHTANRLFLDLQKDLDLQKSGR